jgi:tetratricopeptide (TPR) repeat protein
MDTMEKRAYAASNAYYNLGLSMARVRNLSGAVQNLRISLALNKDNIDARNLLGLVYCEMGDVVEALSQWVVSKSLRKSDNVAGTYITEIQSNQAKFEMISSTIKKYNLSLKYAKEGNTDMATIQLKKVVSQNPQLVNAQLLLALMYLKNKEYAKARKPVGAVLKIDHNNITAQRYQSEIEEALNAKKKESSIGGLTRKSRDLEARPLSGNDVIVPGSSYKEPSNGAVTVVYILLGVVIGAALIWFLVMPARFTGMRSEYNQTLQDYSEQLSSGNVELNALENQYEQVKSEKENLEEKLSEISSADGSNKLLLTVVASANNYLAGKMTDAAVDLIDIDVSSLPSEEAKTLYNTIAAATMMDASTDLYGQGLTYYQRKEYATSVDYMVKSYKCDKTKVDAICYAARGYAELGDTENAKRYYNLIIDGFKTSKYVAEATTYVNTN